MTVKTAMKKLGYEVVQYSKGFNFRSGFAFKGGILFYFSYGDIRWNPVLLYRTANPTMKDKKGKYNDYTGGSNRYYYENDLKKVGIKITERIDYNSN